MGDIAAIHEGDLCARCGNRLSTTRGIELGHIFKLGTKYSEAMGATFLDHEGNELPVVMGCYGIGSGRLMAAVVEQCHDERGIIWPPSVAPYHIHLIALGTDSDVIETAESVYQELHSKGCEVLYDDRDETAGVKFNDADLIGIPLRMTISRRSLDAGGVEVKRRQEKEYQIVSLGAIEQTTKALLG
jgi:prolyl-tRNA synthetase